MAKQQEAPAETPPGMEIVTVEITGDAGHIHGKRLYAKGDRFQVERHFAESIERFQSGRIVG